MSGIICPIWSIGSMGDRRKVHLGFPDILNGESQVVCQGERLSKLSRAFWVTHFPSHTTCGNCRRTHAFRQSREREVKSLLPMKFSSAPVEINFEHVGTFLE